MRNFTWRTIRDRKAAQAKKANLYNALLLLGLIAFVFLWGLIVCQFYPLLND